MVTIVVRDINKIMNRFKNQEWQMAKETTHGHAQNII